MPAGSNNDQDYEEEWLVVLTNNREYPLSKNQALVVKQAIVQGNRVPVLFESFTIAVSYIVEFYRVRRFLKNTKQLTERAMEEEYKPIPPEKWEELKKNLYRENPFLKHNQEEEQK